METYKITAIIKKNNKISIDKLPFKEGEKVLITVSQKRRKVKKKYPLRGLKYKLVLPYEPVAEEDWAVLK